MEKDLSNINKQSKGFIKYSSLAFQMLATIVLGVLLGQYIDKKCNGEGLYLALISLFFVVTAIYVGIKDLIKQ